MASNTFETELLIRAGVQGLNQVRDLIAQIERAGGNTRALRDEYNRLSGAWHTLSVDEQARRLGNFATEANNTATQVRGLAGSAMQTSSAFGGLTTKVTALAGALGAMAVVGSVGNFLQGAIKGAADFEQQLATVRAVSGATTEEMEKIKAKSEELGRSTRYTAKQAAEGFEVLARAGLTTSQSIETIGSVLTLAQSNGLQLAEASDFITSAVSGMGLSFSDTARVADVLAKTASSAKTDVRGLGSALSYAAPSAHALGMSLEQTSAYIGKFADAGIDASRAGTSLNGMLAQFGDNSSKFRVELAKIGIVTNDFNQAIHELAAAGDKGKVAINALGTEAGPALKALLSQGMPALDELIGKLENAGGTAQDQATIMNNTWQGALASLQSAWDSLENKLGESFLESMKADFQALTAQIVELVDSGKISQLGDGLAKMFHDATVSFLKFTQNLDIQELVGNLAEGIESLRAFASALGAIFSGLNIAFQVFKEGVLTVGTALSSFFEGLLKIQRELLSTANAIGKAFGSDLLDGYVQATDAAIALTQDFQQKAIDGMTKANNSISQSWDNITGKIAGTGDLIGQELEVVGAELEAVSFEVGETITQTTQAVTEGTKGSAQTAKDAVKDLSNTAKAESDMAKAVIDNIFKTLQIDVMESTKGINSETQKTLDLIKKGAEEVGNSTYSASEKTKLLASLFEKGLGIVKTKEEFTELNKIAGQYNLTTGATQDKLAQLTAGMAGGSEAVKQLKDELKNQHQTLEDNTQAAQTNTQAKAALSTATDQAAQAETRHTQAQSQSLAIMQNAVATIKDKIASMQGAQASITATDQAYQKLLASIGATNKQYMDMADFGRDMARINDLVDQQAQKFAQTKASVQAHTQALQKSTVSSDTLAAAQSFLNNAISQSNQGLWQLDAQTLNGLKSAIDSTRAKMQGLANDAKQTADNLEITLAKLRGNDTLARNIEQTRKLADLTAKLNEARKRSNTDEIQQLERALRLQQQINQEENKKAQQERKKQQNPANQNPAGQNNLSAADIADAWEERIRQAEARGAKNFAEQLRAEAKRRAR